MQQLKAMWERLSAVFLSDVDIFWWVVKICIVC